MMLRRVFAVSLVTSLLALFAGCGKPAAETADKAAAPIKIRLQTDWFPQAEHGGFYQALARGYYRDAGLDVEILPGGPGATVAQKLIAAQADVAIARSDDLILNVSAGLPFTIVSAFMQHDPQAILVHAESPVKTFKDLQGRSIMAVPGSNWISFLKARHQIDFTIIPSNFGLAQFMADKTFIQQCFITNEPFYVEQNGQKARTLLIADSGFDPYRVIFTTNKFLREHPEAVRAFVAASLKGWDEFMKGDNTAGKALIRERNDKMTAEFMNYSITSMADNRLIHGDETKNETLGLLTTRRLQAQVDALVALKIMPAPVAVEKFATFDVQPEALRARAR